MHATYPIFVKTYLKVTPSFLLVSVFGCLMPSLLFIRKYIRCEDIPKNFTRSTRYEKLLRYRDDKHRFYFKDMFERQLYEEPKVGSYMA